MPFEAKPNQRSETAWNFSTSKSKPSNHLRFSPTGLPSSLCEFLDINPSFDRNDREVELGHRQTKPIQHSWLPLLRESFFLQHRFEIIYSSAEDCQHGCRTVKILVYHIFAHTWKVNQSQSVKLTSRFQTYCGKRSRRMLNSFSSHQHVACSMLCLDLGWSSSDYHLPPWQ